jgi:drug/metabolite transporter (DMT)-like permease
MSVSVLALVLLSALLHATWNAALRSGVDRLWSMTVMCATTAAIALPVALSLPAPARASWPYLASSALLQVAYCVFLVRAYRTGHLAQVYPIARGSSPLLVTLGAASFAHEHLGATALAGVALASAGIAGCAAGRGRPDRASLFAAVTTGILIAAYTVVDGIGARASGRPFAYVSWLFVAQGSAMALLFRLVQGPLRLDLADRESWKAFGGGILSLGSYGTVVWALTLSPMGMTSALRETSVLFAALLGRVLLGEPLGVARLVACTAIAAGAVLLALQAG